MAPEASRSTNPSSPMRTLSRSTLAPAFCPWRTPDLGPMDLSFSSSPPKPRGSMASTWCLVTGSNKSRPPPLSMIL
ncbi:peptidyl-prolyl cis-trans isomerase 1 [Phtheirospermum japonicum]|uniref:Peptidyl-prolyl cis-trans isomerase 1 n=1 Tax=Phtheirospermum japonicum TaxID=374723 RepID=A0A830C7S5_9LAMI|nr:peptidyl-prolyl cis-trans isomerase 1 [Phtheirospermum japonicum]